MVEMFKCVPSKPLNLLEVDLCRVTDCRFFCELCHRLTVWLQVRQLKRIRDSECAQKYRIRTHVTRNFVSL